MPLRKDRKPIVLTTEEDHYILNLKTLKTQEEIDEEIERSILEKAKRDFSKKREIYLARMKREKEAEELEAAKEAFEKMVRKDEEERAKKWARAQAEEKRRQELEMPALMSILRGLKEKPYEDEKRRKLRKY
jgi:hypothetical protein